MPSKTLSPLDFLTSHFDALKPREVEIPGFPFKLFYHPFNAEHTFKYVAAMRATRPAEQSKLFAELLVETVKLENGDLAFPLEKGGLNNVEALVKRTPPLIFSKLVEQLGKDAPVEQAEALEKK